MTKNFDSLFKTLQKKYDGSVFKLDDIPPYDVVSTGSLALNYALGIGGWPTGRVVEIGGSNSAGKSTIMLHSINEFLKRYPDRVVAFLDLEHRLETAWADMFVEDSDRFIALKPESAEEALLMYRDLARSGDVSAVVWDSIGGAPTEASYEKDRTRSFAGNSGVITEFAKQAMALSGKYNMTTFGINQIRQDLDGYRRYLTPGGEAWKHACSLRIQLKRASSSDKSKNVFADINGEKDVPVGYEVTAKIIKSSVSTPGRVANYWFMNVPTELGFGIDKVRETILLGKRTGVIETAGAWYRHEAFPGGQLQGEAKVSEFLKDNKDVLLKISSETMDAMKSEKADLTDLIRTSSDPEQSIEGDIEDDSRFGKVKSLREHLASS